MSHSRRRAIRRNLSPVLARSRKKADSAQKSLAPGPAILALTILLALAGAGCRRAPNLDVMTGDPFFESFFERTSLIMTNDEIEVYRSLPDRESKAEFIEDFWQSRDTDPSTEENEGRAEFERRVAFANAWFSDWRTFRGKTKALGKEADRGWFTDPGRVYIILGTPDYLSDVNGILEPFDPTRLYREEDPVPAEGPAASFTSMTWVYERVGTRSPRLYVHFFRRGNLGRWHTNIFGSREGRDAIEQAKLNYFADDQRDEMSKPFRCSVKYAADAVMFKIRTSSVTYAEEGEKLKASLKVKVVVYRDGRRRDVVEKTEDFAFAEDDLLALKNLEFSIPWRATENGSYLFDITVRDLKSLRMSAFRTYLRKKL